MPEQERYATVTCPVTDGNGDPNPVLVLLMSHYVLEIDSAHGDGNATFVIKKQHAEHHA